MSDTSITISRKVYRELLRDRAELRRLEAAGVDNWEGYSSGLPEIDEEIEEEDEIEEQQS